MPITRGRQACLKLGRGTIPGTAEGREVHRYFASLRSFPALYKLWRGSLDAWHLA